MKKIFCAAIAAAISLSAVGSVAFAEDEPIKITINDTELVIPEGDTHPFIEDGRTLVPMRAIFEALDTTVEWDAENRRVTANDPVNETTIVLTIDSNIMLVGDEKVELDVPAKIVNDRTMVPVRAIAESLGCVVDWDGESRTVIIESYTYDLEPIACATLDELNENIRIYTP
ncbi:MAG: copper amine oxidase N-terminal domain-containing protein, partial [Clostridia bacterium]|nr:copper amine oxidase N-terminal domain-containing protein [Clostridia bacterium]